MKSESGAALSDQPYDASAFCTTRDAADLLGVSHRTIQLWVENGTLQAWKTAGGHRRITVQSINRLVEQRTRSVQVPPVQTLPVPVAMERKVLMVDDDAAMLRLYELEMSGWNLGLDIRKANNGFEALIKIGEQRPSLLISDLSMPGMDGFKMIRTLRADPAYETMGIIVISGLDRVTIHSMGLPDDIPVFAKPVAFHALEKAVNAVFKPMA